MRVASAVSRGLARCAMRRFGIGEEFYTQEGVMSMREAYESLLKFAAKRGMGKDEFDTMVVDMDVTRETLVDNFMPVWKMIIEMTAEA